MANYFITENPELNVSRGLVKDATVINIAGFNSNIGLEFVPIWESNTAYTYPTSNLIMNIASSNTGDVGISLLISGLDSNYDQISETVILNGTTAVNTTKGFFRINNMRLTQGQDTGTITAANNGTTYSKFNMGSGMTQSAMYTVPRGYEFYLYRIDAFSASALSNKYVYFRNVTINKAANTVNINAEATFLSQLHIQRRFPFKYNEKSDIQYQAKSSSQTNEVSVFVEGMLVKKPVGS